MAKAIWKDQVLAESGETIIIEGNHYFPPGAVKRQFLLPSDYHAVCHWKGVADYYHVQVDEEILRNAAWYYPDPKEAALQIRDYMAFGKGIMIED